VGVSGSAVKNGGSTAGFVGTALLSDKLSQAKLLMQVGFLIPASVNSNLTLTVSSAFSNRFQCHLLGRPSILHAGKNKFLPH
jgi:hypothetical protein